MQPNLFTENISQNKVNVGGAEWSTGYYNNTTINYLSLSSKFHRVAKFPYSIITQKSNRRAKPSHEKNKRTHDVSNVTESEHHKEPSNKIKRKGTQEQENPPCAEQFLQNLLWLPNMQRIFRTLMTIFRNPRHPETDSDRRAPENRAKESRRTKPQKKHGTNPRTANVNTSK